MEAEVGGDHEGVIKLIGEAVRAGAYRSLAREFPTSAGGFEKQSLHGFGCPSGSAITPAPAARATTPCR